MADVILAQRQTSETYKHSQASIKLHYTRLHAFSLKQTAFMIDFGVDGIGDRVAGQVGDLKFLTDRAETRRDPSKDALFSLCNINNHQAHLLRADCQTP